MTQCIMMGDSGIRPAISHHFIFNTLTSYKT